MEAGVDSGLSADERAKLLSEHKKLRRGLGDLAEQVSFDARSAARARIEAMPEFTAWLVRTGCAERPRREGEGPEPLNLC